MFNLLHMLCWCGDFIRFVIIRLHCFIFDFKIK